MMDRIIQLLDRAERLMERAERFVPAPSAMDWHTVHAARWRRHGGGGLRPVPRPHRITLETLQGIEPQKTALERNTRQFLAGLPANNALLWGARGTGKSSLVKALLTRYGEAGLRLVEVTRDDLGQLPEIVEQLADQRHRFILFCDDLSFGAEEAGLRELKAILEGSVSALPDHILVYATSNRRHLVPEYHGENQPDPEAEIHPHETAEEKISLSERFGLWLSFRPFEQDLYLRIVANALDAFGVTPADSAATRAEACRYALARGSHSGRVAWQFARDYAGRAGLEETR